MRDDDRPSTPNPQTGRRKFLVNTGTAAAASVIGAYVPSDAGADVGQSGSIVTGASIASIEGRFRWLCGSTARTINFLSILVSAEPQA